MPRPIDHRDVTLSNPNSETPTVAVAGSRPLAGAAEDGGIKHVDIRIDTRFDALANYTSALLQVDIPAWSDTGPDNTLHQVTARDTAGADAARITWRRKASPTDALSTRSQPQGDVRDPTPPPTSPTVPTSAATATWSSPKASQAKWKFTLELWIEPLGGATVTLTTTTLSNGIRYSISVTKSGTSVFSADLQTKETASTFIDAVKPPPEPREDVCDVMLANPSSEGRRVDVGVAFQDPPAYEPSEMSFVRLDADGAEITAHTVVLRDPTQSEIATLSWRRAAISLDPEAALVIQTDRRPSTAGTKIRIPDRDPEARWTSTKAPATTWSFALDVWATPVAGVLMETKSVYEETGVTFYFAFRHAMTGKPLLTASVRATEE
jgi:hypothetical protein